MNTRWTVVTYALFLAAFAGVVLFPHTRLIVLYKAQGDSVVGTAGNIWQLVAIAFLISVCNEALAFLYHRHAAFLARLNLAIGALSVLSVLALLYLNIFW